MKPINFFQNIDKKEQKNMHTWFYATSILFITLLLCCSIQYMRIYIQLKKALNDQSQLAPLEAQVASCLTEKRTLKEKTKILKEQLAKKNRIKHKPKNPLDILTSIFQKDLLIPQTIQIKNKNATLLIEAPTSATIIEYVAFLRLQKIFKDIELSGLEQENEAFKAQISITLR